MKVLVTDRQAGKTTRLVEWVKAGHQVGEYPHWSRVVVTVTETEAMRIRELLCQDLLGVPHPSYVAPGDVEKQKLGNQIYRMVFAVEDWSRARIGHHGVEVALDNAELVLGRMFGQVPEAITLTGELWEQAEVAS